MLINSLIYLFILIIALAVLWRYNGKGAKLVLTKPDTHTAHGRRVLTSYLIAGPLLVVAFLGAIVNSTLLHDSYVPALTSFVAISIYAAVLILRNKNHKL